MTEWADIDVSSYDIDIIRILVEKISLLDILDRYDIEYTLHTSDRFSHKLKCPFLTHAGGNERTASFYVSEETNKFVCYGCCSRGSIIDFMVLYLGKPYYDVIKILSKLANVSDGDFIDLPKRKKKDPEKTIIKYVYKTGILIRDFVIDKSPKWHNWAGERNIKLDEMLDTLSDDQWEQVQQYHNKIKDFFDKKGK